MSTPAYCQPENAEDGLVGKLNTVPGTGPARVAVPTVCPTELEHVISYAKREDALRLVRVRAAEVKP